ncbi:MAG: flagellar assembly peptidoglycan hydrolase FlgJ [Burkholderiales bacterium]|nr:flagellar assembly peptidoglycan hydrolase FlgJ [Burkholderiales bacterium]MDE2394328.1 flagellar assembly peptidoglycan hydrolase FlgJ [Burkholderiales bacterium]MDE2452484.1 flagellar assembly peptidoglycan hydrolase FlgJ [Burkholderiales bacterium]
MIGNTQGLAIDANSLAGLKARAATDPRAALRESARQFETLFMNEVVKSMRESTLSNGLLDNSGTQLGTQLLDGQLAGQLAGLPGGLTNAIMQQLERQMAVSPGPIPKDPAQDSANVSPLPLALHPRPTAIPQVGAAAFVDQHTAAAEAAAAQTGIPAAFMVAQAAHETGWGRKEIRYPDGSPSHNLFGIKAGAGWNGPVAEVATTEYVNGRAVHTTARFRAYASYAESFADYAKLMKTSPRYQRVLAGASSASGFAQGLQKAGYATDPAYAEKLTRIINTTLRLQKT